MRRRTKLISLVLTFALVLSVSACTSPQQEEPYDQSVGLKETLALTRNSMPLVPAPTPTPTPAQTSNALMTVPTAVAQSMDKDKAGSIALTYLPVVMEQYGKEPNAMNFASTYTNYDRWADMDSALLTTGSDGTPFWHIQVIINDEFFVVVQMTINGYTGDLISYNILFNKRLMFHESAGD